MDWTLAIERHRQPLVRIVAALFAMIGLAEGRSIERLPWPLYRAVLRVLRPAEWAVRRLIVVATRGLVVKPPQTRAAPLGLFIPRKGKGRVSFQLFDPRQRFEWGNGGRPMGRRFEPRIHAIDVTFDPRIPLFRMTGPVAIAPHPESGGTVTAQPLCRRLAAIRRALEDLPRQARRYARWQAKPFEARRPRLATTLRPGAPPGLANKPSHEVHAILTECDWLARTVPMADTS